MIGRIAIAASIVAAFLLWGTAHQWLFWTALADSVVIYLTFRALLLCAAKGYRERVNQLRDALYRSRTLGLDAPNTAQQEVLARDDVDVLVSRILRGSLEKLPSWAVTDYPAIQQFAEFLRANPDRLDPDAQPTWLCAVNLIAMLAAFVLLATAAVMRMW